MNRYTINGIAEDALSGKIIVICGSRVETTAAFNEIAELLRDYDPKVYRANGAERIELPNGGHINLAHSPHSLRGRIADVVYLDVKPATGDQAQEWLESAYPVTVSTRGSIIRP